MIDAEHVIYDYPSGRALDGVSFVVRPGAVLALVGPNGAGKSTLLRCIAALEPPTEGRISVLGMDVRTDPRGVHAALGYLPDFYGLYDALTVRRSLLYAARSRGVPVHQADEASEDAARRVGLWDRLESRAGELSRGLRQRLAIGQAIVHRPRVLLLDEPAAGLDPDARRELSELIRSLAKDGTTLIVSSHILAELEDYCTEMLMLRDGRLVGGGVVDASTGAPQAEGSAAAVRVQVRLAEPRADLAERLRGLGLKAESTGEDEAVLLLPASPVAQSRALAALVGADLLVRSFAPIAPTLEQTYIAENLKAAALESSEAGA